VHPARLGGIRDPGGALGLGPGGGADERRLGGLEVGVVVVVVTQEQERTELGVGGAGFDGAGDRGLQSLDQRLRRPTRLL
jgi:hypothetical protein